jgi:hypothetical protein
VPRETGNMRASQQETENAGPARSPLTPTVREPGQDCGALSPASRLGTHTPQQMNPGSAHIRHGSRHAPKRENAAGFRPRALQEGATIVRITITVPLSNRTW